MEMNCPSCRSAETRTTTSRALGVVVRRCRECNSCKAEWATTERLDEGTLQVITGDHPCTPVDTREHEIPSGSDSGSLSLIPDLTPVSKLSGDREFDEFWAAYPRKTAKARARRSWKKRKPPLAACLKALAWQRATLQWKQGIVPHPSTWINDGRWEDEPPVNDLREAGFSEKSIASAHGIQQGIRMAQQMKQLAGVKTHDRG